MKKKRLILLVSLLALSALSGCQKSSESAALQAEINSLKVQLAELTEENEALKAAAELNETVSTEALLELRNMLDSQLYGTLNALIRGDVSTALPTFTPSVEVKDGIVTSLYGKGTVEFTIPQRPMSLRQRAFWQDGDTFSAIYEVFDAGYALPDERLNTLNVLYLRQNGNWKIDAIFIDE